MDSRQFREAATSSIDEIARYYDNIEQRRPLSNVEPGYLRKLIPAEAPQEGQAWADIQKDIEDKILPGITHWQSPNFAAWFPASSSFPGMLGEMYSAAFTGAGFNWNCSPAATELETIVLDWMARALHLPDCYLSTGPTQGGGVIHGSASEAIVTVLVAARDKYLREATAHITDEEEREDAIAARRGNLVALGSATTHSSTKKAAQIAGVRFRTIPVHAADDYHMTGAELRRTVEGLRARGLEPFFVTATMGTTDTASVDDMESIADVLAEIAPPGKGEIWVHVDAAYAGVARICPEYASIPRPETLARFHSWNTNAHKWMLVNFDCSMLFVRDRNHLVKALSVDIAIYKNAATDSGLVTDYRNWQIPLGRRFRALKLWFVVRTYGVQGLRAHIRHHVQINEGFAATLRTLPERYEIVAGPQFALTVFRVRGGDEEKSNALTKKMYDSVVEDGKLFLSSTVVGGKFAIRYNSATPSVQEHHVRQHFELLNEAAEQAINSA